MHLTQREVAAVRAVNAATKDTNNGRTRYWCYVASTALWNLLGATTAYQMVRTETERTGFHVFVQRRKDKRVLDPTADQYDKADAIVAHHAARVVLEPQKVTCIARAKIVFHKAKQLFSAQAAQTRVEGM